jgi:hypothetical protein
MIDVTIAAATSTTLMPITLRVPVALPGKLGLRKRATGEEERHL